MDATALTGTVFISYSSKDRRCAETVVRGLEKRRLACWFAPRNIPAGSNYMGEICRAIERADVVVALLSAHANESADMKKEIALASQRRLPIIPVIIDGAPPDDDWKYEISIRQYVDASSGIDSKLPALIEQVQRAITAGSKRAVKRPLVQASSPDQPSAQLQPLPKIPARSISRFSPAILACVVIVGLLMGLAYFAPFRSDGPVPPKSPALSAPVSSYSTPKTPNSEITSPAPGYRPFEGYRGNYGPKLDTYYASPGPSGSRE